MRKFFLAGLFLLAAIGLSACNFALAAEPTPTLVPTLVLVIDATNTAPPVVSTDTETAALASATSTPTDLPTRTRTPTPSATITPGPSPTITRTPTRTRLPSRTPTITPTPAPNQPAMVILRPGLLSRVVSPIQMELYAVSGTEGIVQIELVGEDGRVIARQLIQQVDRPGRRIWMAPEVPFEIEAAAETARLQVSSLDELGRVSALASVDLVLLSVGRNEINPPAIALEPYFLNSPEDGDVISGGTLRLDALVRPVNDSPLIVELVNQFGTVLAVKRYSVPLPSGTQTHTPVLLELPYSVQAETPVRLVVRQEGSRIPGSVALTSISLILAP